MKRLFWQIIILGLIVFGLHCDSGGGEVLPDAGKDAGRGHRQFSPPKYDNVTLYGKVYMTLSTDSMNSVPATGSKVIATCDKNGNGVVDPGEQITTTILGDGSYTLNAPFAIGKNVVLGFVKEGYSPVYRSININSTGRYKFDGIMRKLHPLACEGTVCSTEDGTVEVHGIEIGSGYVRAFNPKTETDAFAGNFADSNGNLLISSVFSNFDLKDADGKPIRQLPAGVKAKLRVQVPEDTWSTMDDLTPGNGQIDIPMYYFNEVSGTWDAIDNGWLEDENGNKIPEASLAQIQSGTYGGPIFQTHEVTHFTVINCDWRVDPSCLKGRLMVKVCEENPRPQEDAGTDGSYIEPDSEIEDKGQYTEPDEGVEDRGQPSDPDTGEQDSGGETGQDAGEYHEPEAFKLRDAVVGNGGTFYLTPTGEIRTSVPEGVDLECWTEAASGALITLFGINYTGWTETTTTDTNGNFCLRTPRSHSSRTPEDVRMMIGVSYEGYLFEFGEFIASSENNSCPNCDSTGDLVMEGETQIQTELCTITVLDSTTGDPVEGGIPVNYSIGQFITPNPATIATDENGQVQINMTSISWGARTTFWVNYEEGSDYYSSYGTLLECPDGQVEISIDHYTSCSLEVIPTVDGSPVAGAQVNFGSRYLYTNESGHATVSVWSFGTQIDVVYIDPVTEAAYYGGSGDNPPTDCDNSPLIIPLECYFNCPIICDEIAGTVYLNSYPQPDVLVMLSVTDAIAGDNVMMVDWDFSNTDGAFSLSARHFPSSALFLDANFIRTFAWGNRSYWAGGTYYECPQDIALNLTCVQGCLEPEVIRYGSSKYFDQMNWTPPEGLTQFKIFTLNQSTNDYSYPKWDIVPTAGNVILPPFNMNAASPLVPLPPNTVQIYPDSGEPNQLQVGDKLYFYGQSGDLKIYSADYYHYAP